MAKTKQKRTKTCKGVIGPADLKEGRGILAMEWREGMTTQGIRILELCWPRRLELPLHRPSGVNLESNTGGQLTACTDLQTDIEVL